jgi:hypothetical protein
MTDNTETPNEDYIKLIENMKNLHPDEIKDVLESASSHQYQEIFEDQTKLTTAPHEILIKVNANVLEQNEKGEYTGSKGMFEQNYHIPVPTGVLYGDYVDSFFSFIKEAIIDTINKTDNRTQDTKDTFDA